MTRAYAEGTSVSVEKSKMELDSVLSKYGATQRGIMADDENGLAQVAFVLSSSKFRIDVPLPKVSEFQPRAWKDQPRGWSGWRVERQKAWVQAQWDQACRERWRAVVLLVKAKLELVRIGVSSIEREFMADLVLPNGRTVGAIVATQISEALAGGAPPRLLGA